MKICFSKGNAGSSPAVRTIFRLPKWDLEFAPMSLINMECRPCGFLVERRAHRFLKDCGFRFFKRPRELFLLDSRDYEEIALLMMRMCANWVELPGKLTRCGSP